MTSCLVSLNKQHANERFVQGLLRQRVLLPAISDDFMGGLLMQYGTVYAALKVLNLVSKCH